MCLNLNLPSLPYIPNTRPRVLNSVTLFAVSLSHKQPKKGSIPWFNGFKFVIFPKFFYFFYQQMDKVGTWRDALTHVANIAGYHVDNSRLSVAVKSILGLISQKLSREFSEGRSKKYSKILHASFCTRRRIMWDIVRQESRDEPGKRSRLWHYEDIDNVLKNDTGTEKVQAMDIRGAKDPSIYHEEKEACWRPQGLAPLVTLKGWVLSALSWQGLALLVTLRGWVQRTLSWQDNCTSLERLPEPPNDYCWTSSPFSYNYTVQCFNCFKLAYNIQNFSNMFQEQSGQQFEKLCPRTISSFRKLLAALLIRRDSIKLSLK
ncbi:hypothetical protein CMV_021709 [Castanea mollissima]|uniref:Uncharacterized protein n=1 Tax=Castanea mollissima TaxID=60419 RepID=A0A8J4QJN0_9ROSI|nr:hypothetical protein CMV_021709 [Castanea mollissima]